MAKVSPMESAANPTSLPRFELDLGNSKEQPNDRFNDYRLCAMPAPPGGDNSTMAPAEKKTGVPGVQPMISEGCPELRDPSDAARMTRDEAGRIIAYKSLDGHNFNMTYDAQGRPKRTMETDDKGELRLVETVNYDDENGIRTKASVSFLEGGGLGYASETEHHFKDGKLVEERLRNGGSETESKFDAEGREVSVEEYESGVLRASLNREFLPNGNVSVTSVKYDEHGNKIGQTQAEFDKEENHVGTEVSRKFDENGNETMRMETSYTPGGKSMKVFEKGAKTQEFNSINTTRTRAKTGDTITEQHLGPDGKPTETIEATFFPRQPYLPTKLTVRDADGNATKTIDIDYLTTRSGHINPAGGAARITDISVTTPDGTTQQAFARPNEQIGAWRQLFKATDNINSFSIPIGREPKANRIGAPISYPVRGRTAAEATDDLPASGAAA